MNRDEDLRHQQDDRRRREEDDLRRIQEEQRREQRRQDDLRRQQDRDEDAQTPPLIVPLTRRRQAAQPRAIDGSANLPANIVLQDHPRQPDWQNSYPPRLLFLSRPRLLVRPTEGLSLYACKNAGRAAAARSLF